jgi:hypothetical protein
MPKQVFIESRNQTLEFPDDATQEEINEGIATVFPRTGEDVAFDMSKYQSVSDIRDFIAAIPDDDYIMLNNYSADKKLSWGDLAGIAGDALGTIVGDAVKGAGAAVTKAGEGVTESALRGVAAGTVDIVNLGQKLIKPKERIPTFEEFVAKTPTTNRLVDVPQQQGATGLTYAWPSEEVSATTEDDYKAFINRQRQAEIESLDLADISEKLIQGSPVPEVAKGASYLDAVTLAGLAKSVARSGVKSIYKAAAKKPLAAGAVAPDVAAKGVYTGVETGASFVPKNPFVANAEQFATKVGEGARKAGFTGVQLGAGTVKGAADLGKGVINLANKLGLENAALRGTLGGAVGYQEGGTEGAVMGSLIGSAAPVIARGALSGVSRTADFIGAAAKVAKSGPSRTGIFEKMATSANISPEARKVAEKLLFTQPFVQYAGDVARQATKNAALGAPVGAALGYAADGEQGAAAGFGAGAGIGGLGGAWDASYDAMKSIAGRSTARSRRNAAGDIKSFVNDITDDQARADYGEIMNRAIQVAGPERAADMLDSLRLAESMGATVKTVPPSQRKNAFNEFDYSTNTITINPDRMNAGSVQHEVFHQLFNVGVRGELQKALSDVYLPKKDADGNIIQNGLFTDKEFAKKASELADKYQNNPKGYKYALEQASVLDNPAGFSPEAVDNARSFVIDEMTAAYTEKFMGRSRTGVFNPDRLPMWHRQILENIDDKILNRINDKMFADRSVKDPTAFFTDAEGKPVRVPQLDPVLKRAFSRNLGRDKTSVGKPREVVAPKNPRELKAWATATFGATRDVLDPTEQRPLTEKERKAITAADFDAAKALYQSLPDEDKNTVRVTKKSGVPTDINSKGARIEITSQTPSNVFESFLQVAKDRGMGNQQLANMRQLYASMAMDDGPTFDTVNNPVYKYNPKTGKMSPGVRPASRQEVYPTAITVNSAGGFNVEYIDLSRVKANAQKILDNPKYKGVWNGINDFMTDFGASLRNLSKGEDAAMPSAELLGKGNAKVGAMKRDLIAEAMNVTLPKRLEEKGYINQPTIDPLTLATKEGKDRRTEGSAFRDFRIERLTDVTPTNNRLKMVKENAYDIFVQRYQPDAFTPETLPNGESFTNPDGFRILNKTGSKLFRTYDDTGKLIGVAESKDKAVKKAMDEATKRMEKEEVKANQPESSKRFQPDDQVTTAVPDFKKTPAGDKPLLEVIYFKNQDKFKEAVAKGRVQKGVPIETFENMSLAIHQPDSAMVGDVVMQGDKVVTGQGGVYYPVLFGDKGSFWASTEKAAKSMAEELNKISRLNNGKILMGLTSAPIDKMFSSTTMSNGMMQLLHKIAQSPRQYGINKSTANKILVDAVNTPLVKNDKKTGKTTVFKFDQRLRSSSSMEDNMSIMNELLAPDKSAFPLRKHFVQNIAKSIASHLSQNKRASQEFASLISPSSNKYAKGDIVKGKLSTSGIIQALGDLFSEEFTKDFQSITSPGGVGGYLYAILEMDGEVVPVQNKQHVSYDYSVDSTSGQQPKVHILDKPVKWSDTLGLVNTQDYVPESIKDNVYPTNVGFSFSGKHGNLMVMKPKEGALTPIEITRFQPLSERDLSTRWDSYPKTRGELTKPKIISALKGSRNPPVSRDRLAKFVMTYDNPQDLMDHTYYHGTGNFISETVKPSITMSDRQAEQMGGGGYGEKYWAISLSKSKRKAEAFSGQSRSVRVHPVLLKKSAKVIELPGVEDAADLDNHIIDLWRNQVDAVLIGGGEQELAVINPRALVFAKDADTYQVFGGYKSENLTLGKAQEVMNQAAEVISNPESTIKIRFQPDPTSPNILNGSDGSRIIKSNSGKYRVYLATGALAGVKDTLESAKKLIERKSK